MGGLFQKPQPLSSSSPIPKFRRQELANSGSACSLSLHFFRGVEAWLFLGKSSDGFHESEVQIRERGLLCAGQQLASVDVTLLEDALDDIEAVKKLSLHGRNLK